MRASLHTKSTKSVISFNILLVLQILYRYKLHACRLTCTDKFPNVPTKFQKVLLGVGAIAPLPPLATLVVRDLSLVFLLFSFQKYWVIWKFRAIGSEGAKLSLLYLANDFTVPPWRLYRFEKLLPKYFSFITPLALIPILNAYIDSIQCILS